MLYSKNANILKKGLLLFFALLLFVMSIPEEGKASFVDPIDQTSDSANTIPNSHGGSKGVGQSFTAGKTGWMYDVEAFIWNSSATEREISLTIHEGEDINGTVLGVAKVSSNIVPNYPGGWIHFTFNDGIYMESNKQYTIMMETTNNDPNQVLQVTWGIYQPSSYGGGTAYYSGIWSHSNYDFAFKTYVATEQRDYSTSLQMDQLTTVYGDTEEVRATLLDAQNQAVANKRVTFSLDGTVLGSANTNGNGEAVLSYSVNTSIGNYTLTAEFAGDPTNLSSNDSVIMRVDKRQLVAVANDATREYGTNNPVFTGSMTGTLSSDGITATYATSATSASDVGNYAIEATLVDPNNKLGNYEVTKTAGKLEVTKAPLTVKVNDATREYGENNPTLTGAVTGKLAGDGITATYETSATSASDVGNYAIEATLVDPNNKLGNYEVTKTAGKLEVTKAPLTVKVNDVTREYGANNPTLTGAVTGNLVGDGITATYETSATSASNVGNYAIEVTLVDPNNKLGNYEVTKTVGKMAVTKVPLTVTADDATREYGTDNPPFTGSITGALSSDGITATYTTSADLASGVGSYTIEVTLVDPNNKLGNYEVTKTAGKLAVTKVPWTVSPKTKLVTVGDTTAFTVKEHLSDGTTKDQTIKTTFTVDNSTIATIQGNVLTAIAPGTVSVTATYGSTSDTATITVVNRVVPPVPQPIVPGPMPSQETTATPIMKRVLENGEVQYRAILTRDNIQTVISSNLGSSDRAAHVVFPTEAWAQATLTATSDALNDLANQRTDLFIETALAKILVPHTSLNDFTEDLFFRIVPVKTESGKVIEENAQQNEQVQTFVGNQMTVNLFGHPVTIETNIQNKPVTITLPIPTDVTEEQLKSLFVYIEHSDGTTEVKQGRIVEMAPGVQGFTFDVTHFSTFALLYSTEKEGEAEEKILAPYIQGYPDGTFKPNVAVTRSQMATMLARFLTNGEIPTAQGTFEDTKNNASKDAIEFVKQAGLFNGTSETKFDPNGTITRAQMAGVVARWIERECVQKPSHVYCQETGKGKIFTDVVASHWAATSIERVSALGIMSGNSATTFNPNGALTRAQAVKVLNQLFERPALEGITTSTFEDVPATHWAIGDIEAAATEQTLKKLKGIGILDENVSPNSNYDSIVGNYTNDYEMKI